MRALLPLLGAILVDAALTHFYVEQSREHAYAEFERVYAAAKFDAEVFRNSRAEFADDIPDTIRQANTPEQWRIISKEVGILAVAIDETYSSTANCLGYGS